MQVDPNYATRVITLMEQTPHIRDLDITLAAVTPGQCSCYLLPQRRHQQQTGVVHAGVLGSLADIAAGAAALTLVAPEQTVLSVEYKVNLLRAAKGPMLYCTAQVIKPGRRISVVEAQVFTQGKKRKLVSSSTFTLMPY